MVTSDFTSRLSNAFLNWKSVPFSPEEVPLYSRLNVSYKKQHYYIQLMTTIKVAVYMYNTILDTLLYNLYFT